MLVSYFKKFLILFQWQMSIWKKITRNIKFHTLFLETYVDDCKYAALTKKRDIFNKFNKQTICAYIVSYKIKEFSEQI